MIRAVALTIGGLLLLLVACPLHAMAKISEAHHKLAPMEPGHPTAGRTPRA
jgi:type IV secretory pathway VirB3-like protein